MKNTCGIDRDGNLYEPTTTQSTFISEQGWFDIDGYVDPLVKNVNEEIERKLAEIGYIKVVRCKDCKNYDHNKGVCFKYMGTIFIAVREDDYCSRGERKEETEC